MYMSYAGENITKLLDLRKYMDFELCWDGACGEDKIMSFVPVE